MNGAERIMQAASRAGIRVCFMNPGTTEMHLLLALDRSPRVRSVLALFEGVASGAADGYGRMTGQPAMTLTHLGPGFANSIANLHNARRARTPLVSVIGEQSLWHVNADAPLTSDIATLARPMSGWVRTVYSSREAGRLMLEAVAATLRERLPATLIVPMDTAWSDAPEDLPRYPALTPRGHRGAAVRAAAEALRRAARPILLLGGTALTESGLRAAARVAAATGARLMCDRTPPRWERGAGLPAPEPLAYFPEQMIAQIAGHDCVILAGEVEPVAFFGYRDRPGRVFEGSVVAEVLARPEEDSAAALAELADLIGAADPPAPAPASAPEPASGPLDLQSWARTVAAVQPEGSIIVDESLTSGVAYLAASAGAATHTYSGSIGGAIGQGIPVSIGAAIAAPDRPVITLQADGSAMYTIQGLWTQAREKLNVVTLICSNRRYHILKFELRATGADEIGDIARGMTDLDRPQIDWVRLAEGMGVPGSRASTAEQLADQLKSALKAGGPHLIEMVLP